MYLITKYKSLGNLDNLEIKGIPMGSKEKKYDIGGTSVKNIVISNSLLATPIIQRKVMKKYKRLIAYLTELLVDDDSSGDAMREVLNQIEKFRLEITIKYRKFLKQKELEMMSKQLVKLQKIANEKLLEIHNSYLDMMNHKRSK